MEDSNTQEFEWLCIFLVYNNSTYDIEKEKNSHYIKMEWQKNSLFSAIQDSPFSEKIKIVIVEARIWAIHNKMFQVIHVVEKINEGFPIIDTLRNANLSAMSDEDSLADIVGKIVQNFPANRNICVTFGHGSIFGINYLNVLQESVNSLNSKQQKSLGVEKSNLIDNESDSFKTLFKTNFLSEIKLNRIIYDVTKSLNQDEINVLTNNELNKVINTVYKGKKLDILLMYNCLMQNVFTQYELSSSVDYLVAPLSGICHPGYNYREVFSQLNAQPDVKTEDLAKMICMNVATTRIPRHNLFLNEIENTWKLHSVKLEANKYEDLKEKFHILLNEAYKLSKTNYRVLYTINITARQLFNNAEYSLPQVKMIDLNFFLIYWLEVLKKYGSLALLIPYITDLSLILNSVKSDCFTGGNFYKSDYVFVDKQYLINKVNSGFGIWLPDKTSMASSKIFQEIIFPSKSPGLVPSLLVNSSFSSLFSAYLELYS